jgi:hypothetical protein
MKVRNMCVTRLGLCNEKKLSFFDVLTRLCLQAFFIATEQEQSKRPGGNGIVVRSAPKGNRYAEKHGLHTLKRAMFSAWTGYEAGSSDLAKILGAVGLSWGGGEAKESDQSCRPQGLPSQSDVSA